MNRFSRRSYIVYLIHLGCHPHRIRTETEEFKTLLQTEDTRLSNVFGTDGKTRCSQSYGDVRKQSIGHPF